MPETIINPGHWPLSTVTLAAGSPYAEGPTTPLDQSLLWLIPYALLMLLMLHAMVEFTLSLLVKRPPANRKPAAGDVLRQRLLALNKDDYPYRLVEGNDCDLELRWDAVDASWYELFAKVKFTTVYQTRLLLDESRNELRFFESLRTSNLFLGFNGWRPRFQWSFVAQWGFVNVIWRGQAYGILPGFPPRIGQVYNFELNTVAVKKEISKVANRSGWTFRPVLWPFQVRRSRYRLFEALSPAPIRRWSRRRFWGVVYPLSYVSAIGYLVAIGVPLDSHNLMVILGISAIWWGVWGFLAWALCGFPAFWRRQSR